MFGLRSARGRAVLASAVLISVLAVVAIVVVLRVREHQHRLRALEDTATTVASLEDARAQLYLELASISGLVFSDDPTLAGEYREAAARLEQDLIQVRAEAAAAGKADDVATLDDLTERVYKFHQTANAAIPILLQGNPETLTQLVAAVMPDTRTEVEAMVATLDQLAESQQAELTAERTTASQVTDDTSWIVIGFGGAALLVAAGIAIATIVSMVRPLASLRASARAITSGNLEARAKVFGPEEAASVARDFNDMAEALLAKTKEYVDTTNLTNDIVAKVDENGRWTFLNDAACQFFGKPREELLGTDTRDFIHPEDTEATVRVVQGGRTRREPATGFVNRQLTPRGIRVVEWNGCSLFDEDGRYVGLQISGRDITERKQMEDALAAKTKEYIATTNLTGDIIAKLDKHGNWAFLNDAACQFYGRSREELLGTDSRAFVHPDDLELTAQSIRGTRAGKALTTGFVNRQITPRGTRIVEWNGYPFFDEEGRYAGIQITGRDVTERKKADEALRESEERYRLLAENVSDVIWTADLDRRYTYVSPSVTAMRGYTPEELIGTKQGDVTPAASNDIGAKFLAEDLAGLSKRANRPLRPRTFEVQLGCKDGSTIWAEVRALFIRDSNGRPIGIQGVTRDITERKKAEEALRESEARYRLLTENTSDLIWATDMNLRYTYMSPSVTRMRGYSVEEIVGTRVTDTLTPASIEAVRKTFKEDMAMGRMDKENVFRERTLELEMYCKDGSTIWTEVKLTFLRDSGGWPVGIVGVTRDISERKRMEEALRESEARYRLLTENTSDLIWTMDLGLRYTYMSPAITRMRGYTAEEIMDAPITETMTPASVEVARKTFAERVALERAGQLGPHDATKVELEMYCKDGSTIWTEMNMVWLRNSEGKPIGILGVTRDISERKKAEAERERLNAELEMRAITDSLTGLYDHAHFYQRLAEEIDRSKRYKHGFAVVMMDVDDFKRFNDSRGHQMGDAMLRLVADCIRAGLRSSDIAFRYGGDEFSAILPHADSSKAKAAVSRINGHIAKKLKQIDGGSATRLSLSAGVACFPEDGTTADVLVRIADAALYSAKWVARARDIMGQREDIQSLISALVSRRGEVESPADGTIFRPEALHEQQARIVSSVASSIAVALKDAGVSQALEDPDLQVLATVGAAAEIKDRYIRGHPERTSEVAAALAEEMGLSSEQVRNIKIAGLLHDIGKITVSESILNKPGKLTKREFANIKDHPIVGATLVSQVKGFEHLIPIVRHHHERFDGKGYPDGLTGEEIPLEARIMSVVDVFDALTHERSYREALNSAQATAELERSAGTQFDPVVLEAFLALAKARGDALTDFPQAAGENGQPAAAKAAGRGKR